MTIFVLDTGPIGKITHPKESENQAIGEWLGAHLRVGTTFRVPEIADYELRRSLIRIGSFESISRLDQLEGVLGYLPITTPTMRLASEYWATARKAGIQTAPDPELDGDVILAAQAKILANDGEQVVVATENVGHIARFVSAEAWWNLPP
jgi:hypothetical protein